MIAACVLDASIRQRQDISKKRQRKNRIDVITHKTFNCLETNDKKIQQAEMDSQHTNSERRDALEA